MVLMSPKEEKKSVNSCAKTKEQKVIDFKLLKKNIGKQVISLDFGLGLILSIETLDQMSTDKYYLVEYGNKKVKNFFPINKNKSLRFATSKKNFIQTLLSLKKEINFCHFFKSKKERIEYFKTSATEQNLDSIVRKTLELSNRNDLTPHEVKFLQKLISSLKLEALLVLNLNEDEFHQYI